MTLGKQLRATALVLSAFLCNVVVAQSIRLQKLVPGSVMPGARAIVVGTGLDTSGLSLMIPVIGGGQTAAPIFSRSASVIDFQVPPNVTIPGNGTVGQIYLVNSSGTTLSQIGFYLSNRSDFATVMTRIAPANGRFPLKSPRAVALTSNLTAYVADAQDFVIKTVTQAGVDTVFAGDGRTGYKDGSLTAAEFNVPQGIAYNETTNTVYVADTGNNCIRKIANGTVSTLAGTTRRGDADGTGSAAAFYGPEGLALDSAGNLYVADTGNHKIKKITPQGVVTTVAGNGRAGSANGTSAQFRAPEGLAVDASGNIFVADTGNNSIRKISGTTTSTIAGSSSGYLDGNAAAALFNAPKAITIDPGGRLLISDTGNNVIRDLNLADPWVRTVVGTRSSGGYTDGNAWTALLRTPIGTALRGSLVIADSANDALREARYGLQLNAIYPTQSALSGGSTVRVFGFGFLSGITKLTVGNVNVTPTIVDDTLLTFVAPSSPSPSIVDVKVSDPYSTQTLTGALSYVGPPTIANISPASGRTSGGTQVTIAGSYFSPDVTQVNFGTPAATVLSASNSSLTVQTPPNSAGAVNVTVSATAGQAVAPNAFTYLGQPTITSFSPAKASPGTTVTITGTNFDPTSAYDSVSIGSVYAFVTSASMTQLTIVVPQGAVTGRINLTSTGGSTSSATNLVIVNLLSVAVTPSSLALVAGAHQQLTATAAYDDNTSTDVTQQATWTSTAPAAVTVSNGLLTANAPGRAVATATFGGKSGSASVTVTAGAIPPDPATTATPIDQTIATNFTKVMAFLYSGSSPVQSGVVPGAIDSVAVAVVRGRVVSRDGTPAGGVVVTVLGHPEFGYTQTRADGGYDIALNGGGPVTLKFSKSGYLPLQRTTTPRWTDFVSVDDVVLTAYDTSVSAITFGSSTPQVAAGSSVSDSSGTRQAVVLIPQGTTATASLPNGSTQSLDHLAVRLTEYSVGSTGPQAMPGVLPAQTAYTYCVELSGDDTDAMDAVSVNFSKQLPVYVDNFLSFPVGAVVPAGYYDRTQGTWVAAPSGRVIKIVALNGGIAAIDTDGDDVADDDATLAALGITAEERQTLGGRYAAGKTLWRVPVTHFTPYDFNWAARAPFDAVGPNQGRPWTDAPFGDACKKAGSIIECENAVLGEALPLVGTGTILNFRSDRFPGRVSRNVLKINVSGPAVPSSLRRIELTITVRGRRYSQTFAPLPNQTYTFVANNTDLYGRLWQGAQHASVRLTYVYNGVYTLPAGAAAAWGALVSSTPTTIQTRAEIPYTQEWEVDILTPVDARAFGLGGWSLGDHHLLDVAGGVLYRGDGSTSRIAAQSLRNVAGSGLMYTGHETECVQTTLGDNGPATAATVDCPDKVAVGPDGVIYILQSVGTRIRRISRNGIITTYAGTGVSGYSGDGGPATAAHIRSNWISIGPDGLLYLSQSSTYSGQIRRINADGTIVTIAGAPDLTGSTTSGTPALQFHFGGSSNLAWAADGTMYAADGARLVRISGGTVDVLSTIPVDHVGVGPDGDIYAYDTVHFEMFRWKDGAPQLVTGYGDGPASGGFLFDRDGTMYIASLCNVHAFNPRDGRSYVVAGSEDNECGVAVDEANPHDARFNLVRGIASAPNGDLLIADFLNNRVRRIGIGTKVSPTTREYLVPSSDGSEVYAFDEDGRHLRTMDALTGSSVLQFSYTDNLLSAVTDAFANTVTIGRATSGAPQAIVGPYGDLTTVTTDGNGFLTSVANPASETVSLSHSSTGLLMGLVDERSGVHTFAYDVNGYLRSDSDPIQNAQQLARVELGQTTNITLTSPIGRMTQHVIQSLDDGSQTRTQTNSSGLVTTTTIAADAITTISSPGSMAVGHSVADPRFGSSLLLSDSLALTNGSLQSVLTLKRTVSVAQPDDLWSLTSLSDELTRNGKTFTSTYTAANHTQVRRSLAGRTVTNLYDGIGRLVAIQVPNLADVVFSYDARGRVAAIAQGNRQTTVAYDAHGRVGAVTDALQNTVGFDYDASGRVTRETRPDQTATLFAYDAAGNITSITPPGRSAHLFHFTLTGLLSDYVPPIGPAGTITYGYNADRQLTSITRSDSTELIFGYDPGGRLATLTTADGRYDFTYASSGVLSSISAPNGETVAYGYDGQLITSEQWTGIISGLVSHSFNNDFHVSAENGFAYSYDSDGLLTSAGAVTLTRDSANGLLAGSTVGNFADSWTYTAFGEPAVYSQAYQGIEWFREAYTRDSSGRLTQNIVKVGVQVDRFGYVYDAAGRLTAVLKNDATAAAYTYDANGNRLTRVAGASTETGTYNDQDQLIEYAGASYSYAANGELHTKTETAGTTTYEYDAVGSLRKVTLPSGLVVEYIIDPNGRRIGKILNGGLVRGWLYGDEHRIVAELDGTGATVKRFVYGSRPTVPDYMIWQGVTYRIISDHVGSPRIVAEATGGTVIEQIDYDEYGNVLADSNPGFIPFGFAGGLRDIDTGLTRFGARDYDPHTGRFVTKDPLGFDGGDTNLYAYVVDDPINLTDPIGTDWVEDMEPVSDFFAGMGDDLSFGLTTAFNNMTGASAIVDRCSGAYGGGELFGKGVGLALSAAHLGRNIAKQGLTRILYDDRGWQSVRRMWSGSPPSLLSTGRSLHHWLLPQRLLSSGIPRGIINAGFNYMPISAGFNSWMNGATLARTAAEYGFKGVVAGIYGGLFRGGSAECGCR